MIIFFAEFSKSLRLPYPVPIAANEPLGIFTEGFFKSPLMLIPANIPVMVGKNIPKHLNHV